jgi:hypothetical protein
MKILERKGRMKMSEKVEQVEHLDAILYHLECIPGEKVGVFYNYVYERSRSICDSMSNEEISNFSRSSHRRLIKEAREALSNPDIKMNWKELANKVLFALDEAYGCAKPYEEAFAELEKILGIEDNVLFITVIDEVRRLKEDALVFKKDQGRQGDRYKKTIKLPKDSYVESDGSTVLSSGWDNKPFPKFELDEPTTLKCIMCYVDGGESYLIVASNSDEAKKVLSDAIIKRHPKWEGKTEILFKDHGRSTNSWFVGTMPREPALIYSIPSRIQIRATLYAIEQFAKHISRRSVREGCNKCSWVPEEDWDKVKVFWESETICGDSFHWECPSCEEVHTLSDDDC